MLLELRVENLLLIERAELRLGPGLTAITGETGAGKTVLAHALDLLLGGRPRAGIVRPGAREAYVEGVFEAPAGLLDDPALGELRERVETEVPEFSDGNEIVLGRRVSAEGRTRAFVQGRSAAAGDLRELGARLVAFYGQHEHRKLTVAAAQLDLLDGFCGPRHLAARDELRAYHARTRELRQRLEELRDRAAARDRDLDLLAFEIEEIEGAAPSEEEEAELAGERERLRRIDALRAAAGAGSEAIAPEGGDGGAATALAEAERLADAVAAVDPQLDSLTERLRALRVEAEDLGADLRRYGEGLEGAPGRLEQVEERLELFGRLKRKHGGSVGAVLAHLEHCRSERDRLEHAEVALEQLGRELAEAEDDRHRRAAALTATRREAAPRLAARVLEELRELAMEDASFSVELQPRAEIGPGGAERVEFMIAPNPGVPAAPLRETASGGELSRVMLALMSVASGSVRGSRDGDADAREGAAGAGTLVFDEVDAGVGGQTARAVGDRLRGLASARQVICITHLPQIASLAEHHFRIEKSQSLEQARSRPPSRAAEPDVPRPGARDEVARATVERLEDAELVAELCRMLGADSSDPGARRHAEELLAAA
jgi:DNA repair protein RecN (Recombination protein N)